MASEKGCKIPSVPTLFGPKRICIYPKIFRSSSVMKATPTRENTKIEIILKICINSIEI